MTKITTAGQLLAASPEARTLTYRLLPFGEPGRTSAGTVVASPGSVALPENPDDVVLNLEHDPLRPLGRAVQLVEHADGIDATFRVAATRSGDDLLAEAGERLRTGISVELDNVVIRAGRLISSQLTGAGAVVAPAFPSAQLVAADTGPDPAPTTDPGPIVAGSPQGAPVTVQPTTTVLPAAAPVAPAVPVAAAPVAPAVAAAPQLIAAAPVAPAVPVAAAPVAPAVAAAPQLIAAAPAALPAAAPALDTSLAGVTRLLAAVGAGRRDPQLIAALSDIVQSTTGVDVEAPAFIGEVWSGNQYERQIVPLIGHGDLSSYKVVGWRWTTAPVGADYAGDKEAVSSNAATTEPVEFDAARWAGAHDVDRKFRDFGNEAFWSSYWQAMAASYSRWSDAKAVAALLAAAPADATIGYGVVNALITGALNVIPYGRPTFVLLGASAFAELAQVDPKLLLSGSINLGDGSGQISGLSFGTHPSIPTDHVLVGTRNAATWYELGGGAPIRVDAVNVANGGIDVGAFGYGVCGIHSANGLSEVTVTQAP